MTDAGNKTQPTEVSPEAFIAAVENPVRRADAEALDTMFRRVTGWRPRMWGPKIIGYGAYHYVYDSGREGDFLATGFSPRKANQVLYIMPGYQEMGDLLDRLGPYKMGKSCLYVTRLEKVDMGVLEEIVQRGLDDLRGRYEVTPT